MSADQLSGECEDDIQVGDGQEHGNIASKNWNSKKHLLRPQQVEAEVRSTTTTAGIEVTSKHHQFDCMDLFCIIIDW